MRRRGLAERSRRPLRLVCDLSAIDLRADKRLRQEIAAVKGGDDAEEMKEEDLKKMTYLKAVVMEGLRRHPPAHLVLPHSVSEDVTIEGYEIPKGSMVNFLVAEMGWDEAVWDEAMEFKPEKFMEGGDGHGVDVTGRREIKMMPFGVGRRICPGMELAMLQLEYLVANMVKGEEVDLAEKLEFMVVCMMIDEASAARAIDSEEKDQ
ncbi:hypothetical protein Cni_G18816 [Canna indica]|uniref:Cytochrome P450 n=1 Tax=Canna indica TaxID=4628 RepID=A0AAQ3KJW6_9LILI|nr:hypothetical protein Cni_G18816 [Canna indica]